ncbi:MAG: PIG-L family deacetylase [Candidatus Saccharibacteria bacterium]
MKKIIFGIFAHPDDEAFGPSGTLLLETRAGTELHLISLTAGENGTNPDNLPDLGATRLEEWHAAGKLIGATELHYLGFVDGTLSNMAFLEAVKRIEKIVRDVIETQTEDIEVEFMSMDLNGLTGHIDHIVAARAACFVFYKLKRQGLPLTRIRLACLAKEVVSEPNLDFVFMEPGRTADEISETIDARSVVDEVYAIMRTHHTQRGDGESHITNHGKNVAINNFIVKT